MNILFGACSLLPYVHQLSTGNQNQVHISGESRDLIFILGYEENPQEEKFAKLNGELTSLGEKDHLLIIKRARTR